MEQFDDFEKKDPTFPQPENKPQEMSELAKRFFDSWEKAKNTKRKINILKKSQSRGELEQLSDQEKDLLVKKIAEIVEQKDPELSDQLFETIFPKKRKDFSQKTFADYFASKLVDLSSQGYKETSKMFLDILGVMPPADLDTLVNPAEILKIFAKLEFQGKDNFDFYKILELLFLNEKTLKFIGDEILQTIEKDEVLSLFYLSTFEYFMYSFVKDIPVPIYLPKSILKNLIKKMIDQPENSLLTKKLLESSYKRAEIIQREGQELIDQIEQKKGDKNFIREMEKPQIKAKFGLEINFELEDYYIRDFSKDYYGISYAKFAQPDFFLPRGKSSYYENDKKTVDQILKIKTEAVSPEEAKRLQDAKFLFTLFAREETLKDLSEDFGFPLKELTLREQLWFINSLRNYKLEQGNIVSSFTKKFGLDGARAFLSCEYGDKFRETVLSIGENLPEELARQVFEQYSKLALLAQEKSEELTRDFLVDKDKTRVDATTVEQELLNRAKNFLVEISKAKDISIKEVTEKLQNYETDLVVFASIFRTYFKDAEQVDFNDIKGLTFEQINATEITPEEKAEILSVFKKNWQEQKPKAAERLTKGLEEKLSEENKNSRLAILKKDGAIIAFVRFDNIESLNEKSALYVASLNVKKDLRGSAIGESVLKNTIDREAENNTIYADVYPDLLAGTKYVEAFGSVIVGVGEFATEKPGQKEYRLLLRRDNQKNQRYIGKRIIPIEEIITLPPSNSYLEKFDITEPQEILKKVKEMENKGWVGTRYFSDPTNPQYRYILFEADIVDSAVELPIAVSE